MAKVKALRSGFFNAIKDETTELWDRVYTEEDMTDYFRGVIRQNGVFSEIGDQFRPSKVDNQMKIKIGTGKALVNGHWGIIDYPEVITLSPADIRYNRRDYISLRWSDANREVTIEYVKGDTYGDTLVNSTSSFKSDVPIPIGKLKVNESKNRDSFEPVEKDGDTICEIILAYIDIPVGCTNINNVKLTNLVGTHYAPYICYLVTDPKGTDGKQFDPSTYMANLRTEFVEWFNEVRDELVINTNIESIRFVVDGNASSQPSSTIHLSSLTGYTWEAGDTILPFYNGLLLTKDKGEYELNTSNPNDVLLVVNNGSNRIPKDNVLEIVIFRGTPLSFESGDAILY